MSFLTFEELKKLRSKKGNMEFKGFVNIKGYDKCWHCGSQVLISQGRQSIYSCPECGWNYDRKKNTITWEKELPLSGCSITGYLQDNN